MQAIEFSTQGNLDNIIKIPEKFSKFFKSNKKFKIIILFEEDKEEKDWELMTSQQFFNGYADEDAIYDKL